MTTALENGAGKVRLRLHKRDRIHLKVQFDQVRRDGVKHVGAAVVAVVAPSPDGRVECGVICSKHYSLLAVTRNRARRLLWESFRMLKPDLSPCRIVLIPRRKLMKYDRIRTTLEVAGLLAESQVISPERAASPHGC